MGNKPSTSISGVAMRETSLLEDFAIRYPVAYQALNRDSYVDNTNCGADNLEQLRKNIQEIEYVASRGGFIYKPWVLSGSTNPDVLIGPSSDDSLIEKNLGVVWQVTQDLLQIKPNVSYGNKRKGERVSLLPIISDVNKVIKINLRLRDCLSVHAGCFDPLGLVMPVKMVGNILFRDSLQYLKVNTSAKAIPWDEVIVQPLLDKWLDYFSMLGRLADITFPRSVKPKLADPNILPD